MEVTKDVLREVLARLVKEPEFKGYSFTITKDLLSLNDSGIANPNYMEAIPEEDAPWSVHVHKNDEKLTMLATFEVEVRNTMNEGEFEKFVRGKASRIIQEKGKS